MVSIVYLAFVLWTIISLILISKAYRGKKFNEDVYNSIPNVFTTIGVLGTFLGIYLGLQNFETENITSSITDLLDGLKGAFLTSIIGIVLSIIFGRISEVCLGIARGREETKPKDEVSAINRLIDEIKIFNQNSDENFSNLTAAIANKDDASISNQLLDLRSDFLDQNKIRVEQYKEELLLLKGIEGALGGDKDNSLLSQLKKIRIQQSEDNATTSEGFNKLIYINEAIDKTLTTGFSKTSDQLEENKKNLEVKFDEFSTLLARNNTEALVEVMKAATQEFNAQMSELINKLVQENFNELNNSVKTLNNWQIENKEMVHDLTIKQKETTEQFKITSENITSFTEQSSTIVANMKELTSENSELVNLINTLKKVIIDDKRFVEMTENLLTTITKVETNIDSFDATTNKLNDWVAKEKGVKERIELLLRKLDDVSQIRAYNGEFWDETKKQLTEGTNILANNTERLNGNLDTINQEFQSQLGELLGSMDQLIQRIIAKYEIN